jgi:hypothetical protein
MVSEVLRLLPLDGMAGIHRRAQQRRDALS